MSVTKHHIGSATVTGIAPLGACRVNSVTCRENRPPQQVASIANGIIPTHKAICDCHHVGRIGNFRLTHRWLCQTDAGTCSSPSECPVPTEAERLCPCRLSNRLHAK